MLWDLLVHRWYRFTRSDSFEREVVIKILLAIFILYMVGNIIFLAIALPKILINATGDPVNIIHQVLFYYYVVELFLRFFIQSSPAIDLEPYLHLPIKKSRISLYLQLKSVLHPLNILAAVITGPFAFQVIAPAYGFSAAWLWWLSIISISIFLHFFMLIFRKKWEDNFYFWVIILFLSVANYFLGSYNTISLSGLFAEFYNTLINTPSLAFITMVLSLGMAGYSFSYFKQNLYLEDIVSGKKQKGESYSSKLAFLDSYGISGTLILQEIKLILRHKRSRSFLILSVFFLLYGLLFLDDLNEGMTPILLVIGILITGIFMLNYGQLLWSWKTNLLDFYFTRPFPIYEMVKGLHRLMVVSCLMFGLLSIPYVYFGWEILATFMACMIYNMGVNVPIIMRLSMWKPSAIDINKTAFMNYQGMGPAQWLMSIPVLVLPFVVYFAFAVPFNSSAGLAGLAFTGITGLIFYKPIVRALARRMQAEKYEFVKNLTL